MKKIYSTTSPIQAELLRAALRERGIESNLENEGGAYYAVGVPTPAAPLVVSVPDGQEAEAIQVLQEMQEKDNAKEPSAGTTVPIRCASCDKMLEFAKGEDPPEECPWCGLDPVSPVRPARIRIGRTFTAAVAVLILLAAYIMIKHHPRKSRSKASPPPVENQARILEKRLLAKIENLPTPDFPPVDPDALLVPLRREFPEAAERYDRAFSGITAMAGLVQAVIKEYIDLAPDWALELGLSESANLTRPFPAFFKTRALMEATALRCVREMKRPSPSIDASLLERYLEGDLLWFLLHGPTLDDPRAALWGVTASYPLLESKTFPLLAERLSKVPLLIHDLQENLKGPPRLWIEQALREMNGVLSLLLIFEAADPSLQTGARKAREALEGYRTHMKKLLPRAGKVRHDPRYLHSILRAHEFTGMTPAEFAHTLREEVDHALQVYLAVRVESPPPSSAMTYEEYTAEHRRALIRAREMMLERGFADLPPGVDVEIVPTPPHLSDLGDFAYIIQPFSSAPRARFFLALPKEGAPPKQPCYPEMILAFQLRETWPGRILHGIRSRERASLMQRLYDSTWPESGWAEYAGRLGGDSPPCLGPEACSGLRYESWKSTWYALLDLALNIGAIDENETIEFLKGWDGLDEEAARAQVAFITLYPLNYAGPIWVCREICKLRQDLNTELGFRFDPKRFHEVLMSYGKTPITLVKEDIRQHLK